jgi:hypothetical protein
MAGMGVDNIIEACLITMAIEMDERVSLIMDRRVLLVDVELRLSVSRAWHDVVCDQ